MILAIRKAAIIMEKVLHSNQSLLYIEIDGTNSSFTPWNTLYFMTSILFRDDLSCSMMGDFGQRTLEWRNILWFDGKRDQRLYIGAKEQKKQKKKNTSDTETWTSNKWKNNAYTEGYISQANHIFGYEGIYTFMIVLIILVKFHHINHGFRNIWWWAAWFENFMKSATPWTAGKRRPRNRVISFFFFKQIKRILFTSPPSILVEAWNLLSHEDEKAL